MRSCGSPSWDGRGSASCSHVLGVVGPDERGSYAGLARKLRALLETVLVRLSWDICPDRNVDSGGGEGRNGAHDGGKSGIGSEPSVAAFSSVLARGVPGEKCGEER